MTARLIVALLAGWMALAVLLACVWSVWHDTCANLDAWEDDGRPLTVLAYDDRDDQP